MRWHLYSSPEFIKYLHVNLKDNVRRSIIPKEDDMFVFVSWMEKRLNTRREKYFIKDGEFTFQIKDSDDELGILGFAGAYIRACQNPLGGACMYQDMMSAEREPGEEKYEKSISKEVFKFTNRSKIPEIDKENIKAIALVITGVHKKNPNKPEDHSSVTVRIVAAS